MSEERLHEVLTSLPLFAKTFLTVRGKSFGTKQPPFILNRAQRHLHARLEEQLKKTGKVRAVVLKGRQQGCCYSPDTKVLTSTYQWVPIKDIQLGQTLWSVDENPIGKTKSGRDNERRIRVSTVEAKVFLKKEAYEITLSNGVTLKVTGEHRHLCLQRGGCMPQWREINNCKVGDKIRAFCPPPTNTELDYESGWVGGLLDGEGSFGAYPAARIALSQVDGPVLRRYKSYLDKLNIKFYELIDYRDAGSYSKMGDKPVHCVRVDRQADIIRLLAQTNPIRFIKKPVFEGKKLPKECLGFESWVTILSIKPIGEIDVVDLQTSEKTFIAEGLVSHNSTYIQLRFFHKLITNKGVYAFILTHKADATKNIFSMTKRFYDMLPVGLAPKPEKSSVKEMYFKSLGSGYSVGTAGGKGTGRSFTIQLLHGSEAAFWENTDEIQTGLLQTIPGCDGTEIILESTAQGMGNFFHNAWRDAVSGLNGYQAIFLPWYWQDEYTAELMDGDNPSLDDDELEYMKHHEKDGLTIKHLYWRRLKIREFPGDYEKGLEKFKVEYPFTAIEAFRNPVDNRFIDAKLVMTARQNKIESESPLVIGCDPAYGDRDRFAIIRRRGRYAYGLETHQNMSSMEIVHCIRTIIDKEKPAKVCIDSIAAGGPICDRLIELGYESIIEPVNVARHANDRTRFANLRAELWHEMMEWFAGELPVQIPDSDELMADLTSLGYSYRSNGQLLMQSKDELKSLGMRSPDCADALAMTFAVGGFMSHGSYKPNILPAHTAGMFV